MRCARDRWTPAPASPAMPFVAPVFAVPVRGRRVPARRTRSGRACSACAGSTATFVGLAELRARAGRRRVLAFARRLARVHGACVALHIALGLALALLLNELRFARTALRIAFLTPWMVAPAVGATIWLWLLEPQFGVVNYLLQAARPRSRAPLAWLGEPGARVRVGGRRRRLARRAVRDAADARRPADDSRASSTRRRRSTARARGSASATSRCRTCATSLVVASTLDIINTIRHYDIIGVMTGRRTRRRDRGAAGAALQHGVPRQPLRRGRRDRRAAARRSCSRSRSSTCGSRGRTRRSARA